jgi:predicted secreted hydrolase
MRDNDFHIIPIRQNMGDGTWLCQARVDGTEWKQNEYGDTNNAAKQKALDQAKLTIDRRTDLRKKLRVE